MRADGKKQRGNDRYSVEQNLYTAEQARTLDRIAIEQFGHKGLMLMKRAGSRAFSHITRNYSDFRSMIVLCGTGNNGGDGYVVAGHGLSVGMDVRVIQSGPPQSSESRVVCEEYLNHGGRIETELESPIGPGTLIVDGLLGTGISEAPRGQIKALIESANTCESPIISLDVPSGLDSDTGFAFEPCINAHSTVTFIGKKLGLFTASGRAVSGDIIYEKLELDDDVFDLVPVEARIITPLSLEAREPDTHKGCFGNVVVAGGGAGMLGATLLAGTAALRCGSGLVTILSSQSHMDLPALYQPELMSQCVENEPGFAALMRRCDVVILGPGLGQDLWSENLFQQLISSSIPMVVDADGLNLLSKSPLKCEHWVLTPHPAEAGRLLGLTTEEVQRNRVAAVRAISEQYGGVCVLKGSGTLVAHRDSLYLCDKGNPGMATAGMGDVLSGIIGSFIGQKFSLLNAATKGVWLHSHCADSVSMESGMHSLVASDIVTQLKTELGCLSLAGR